MKRVQVLSLVAVVTLIGSVVAYCWTDWRVERSLNVARLALKSRDPDRAFQALQSAELIAPESGEVQFWMARAYRRQGRLSDVHDCLDRARKRGIAKSRILREEWLAMAQAGQMAEVEPHLPTLLVDPGDDGPEICEAFANGYMVSYRYSEAFAVVDAWQKDFPADAQPHVFRGMVANNNSAWTAAAQHFQKAFELAPQRDDVRLQLANALLVLRNTADAAAHFQQLLKSRPNDPEVQAGWGRTLLELGRLDEAREIFSKALKAHPQDFNTLLSFGQVELNANQIDVALPLLQQAVAIDPDDSEAHNSLAAALQRAGHPNEARTHFEFVAKEHELSSRMQTLRDRITHAPKNLEARFELAELLRGKSRQSERIKWLRSIIEIDPKHSAAHAALAEHYERIGDTEMAMKHRALSETQSKASEDVSNP